MKTLLKLAVLAVAGTSALALAGNALATQKLSVSQTATSLTIKVSQAQTDPQPAKISIFVPTGYTLNTSQAPGTKIGTTTGSVFARDANIPLPLSGDVVVAPPNTNAAPCFTGTHPAVWLLRLQVAGQTINLPVAVDPTTGTNAALGAFKLVTCLGAGGRSAGDARPLAERRSAARGDVHRQQRLHGAGRPEHLEGAHDAVLARHRHAERGGHRRDALARRHRHAVDRGTRDEQEEADRPRLGTADAGRCRSRRIAGQPAAER